MKKKLPRTEIEKISNGKKLTEEFLEYMSEINPDALYPTDLKEAVIGMVERFGLPPLILVDKTKVLGIYQKRDGMTAEEALEFFEVNTMGAWVGDGTPCYMTRKEDIA